MNRDRLMLLRLSIIFVTLATSCVFLFARLGRYALWDDEANTALLALSVWRTGDTSAVIGHNILAYNGGVTLSGLRERYIPPIQYYVAAFSLGTLGRSNCAARLPFALCGLGCIALMLRWAWREGIAPITWSLLALAITGDISIFLYSRQCRYYAVVILTSVALAYIYRFRSRGLKSMIGFSLVSIILFATNYMSYVVLYACLAVDYVVWERKRHALTSAEVLGLVLPQVVACIPIALIWNPIGKRIWDYHPSNWLSEKLTLFWWNWRDLARCEFGVGVLLVAAPLIGLFTRQVWLLRAFVALVVYVSVVTIVSPQPVGWGYEADIRYLRLQYPFASQSE